MSPNLQHYLIRKPRLSQFLLTAFHCSFSLTAFHASSPTNYWQTPSYNLRIEEDTIFIKGTATPTEMNCLIYVTLFV
jgi:hypothetical protein